MLYTPKTKVALRICYEAHAGQLDRAGMPYVFHPFHVAEQMETEDEVCVALLHDVVEDTELTLYDLRAAGMGDEVLAAVALLSHDPGVPYLEYVASVAENELARRVKVADLRHNCDLTRLDAPTERDHERIRKYHKALEVLGEHV